MSIGGIPNNTNYMRQVADRRQAPPTQAPVATPDDSQTSSTGASAPASRANFFGFASNPTDEVKVNLPNGLSIGMMHFGSPLDQAGEDQMINSMADLAKSFGSLADQPSYAASTNTTDPTQAAGGQPGDGSEDSVHLDMPNGVSFDIMHWSQNGKTDAEQKSIDDQLTKAAAALADALKAYIGGASTKAGTPGAAGSAANNGAAPSTSHDASA